MIIRDHINKLKRKYFLWLIVSYILLIFFLALEVINNSLFYVGLIGTIICLITFFICLYFIYVGIRCLQCNNGLGSIVFTFSKNLSLSQKIQFCPYCGINLDTDIKE
jgi:hypothetical protein